MDKNSLIGFGLIGAILIAWTYYSSPSEAELQQLQMQQYFLFYSFNLINLSVQFTNFIPL